MVELNKKYHIGVKKFGFVNWIGFKSLWLKECNRFMVVWQQTLLSPLVSSLLFLSVLSLALGNNRGDVLGYSFISFLAPGLIAMSILGQSFSHSVSSLMIGKIQGNIVDMLYAPLSALEVSMAIILAALTRSFLIAIISIYWISGTTDITQLYELGIDSKYQNLLWLAFFSSFAVKTPMWPVHTWLPDAHVEAPTAGSVLLAAILLKMAGYGFIRFSLGLFPIASELFTPLVYILSLIAIVYTSLVALMQEDMKKLIAYSSVAHMGFVTLGIFTITQQGIEGSIVQMISHGLVSAALFLCVGVVYDRMHSRLIATYGGLVSVMPKYSILFMFFTLAALGLPGTSGFIGEFLVLMGAFKDNFLVAVIASLGVIFGAAYMLWLYRRVVFGEVKNKEVLKMPDLDNSEKFILWCLAIPVLFFGFYPEPLINTIEISVKDLIAMYNFNLNMNITEVQN